MRPPPPHTHTYTCRVKKQMETHSSLFSSSGYEIDSKVIGLRVNSAMPTVVRIILCKFLWHFISFC